MKELVGIVFNGKFYALPRDAAALETARGEKPPRALGTMGYTEKKEGYSIGMSCHPDLIPERNALLRKHGITGVHYDPNQIHNCRITSRAGRRRAMKVLGFHDRDGGYGDG